MTAIIYKPAKNTMQSGKRKGTKWLLTFPAGKKKIDPIMGWVGSDNTTQHIKLSFDTKNQAVAFATQQNLNFEIVEPNIAKTPTKKYEDNFK